MVGEARKLRYNRRHANDCPSDVTNRSIGPRMGPRPY